jgi:PGF-pre-PGF domain-containing protein
MNNGSSCNLTWTVNATGELNTTWEFYTIFESEFVGNETPHLNITITNNSMAPQITINSPAASSKQGAVVPINATIFSNTSLISSVQFRFENTTWNSTTWTIMSLADSANNIWFYNYSTSNLSDGNYTIRISANNSYGLNNQSTVNITADTHPPQIFIVSSYPQNTNNTILNYTYIEANKDKVWYVLDNSLPVNISGNTTLALAYPGRHSITLYINDTYGNQNSTSLDFSENFAMNMSNWTLGLDNYIPEATSVKMFNGSGSEITTLSSVYVNTTLNLTIQINTTNVTLQNFNGLNASWMNYFNASETDINVKKAVFDAGLNTTKMLSMINVSNFIEDEYYNATLQLSPNSTGFHEMFYCDEISATFADAGVDNSMSCGSPGGTIGGCYNTTSCSNFTSCNGSFTGNPCYVNSAGYLTVYVLHMSAVAGANDTAVPQIIVNSPTNTTYSSNSAVNGLNANLTTSSDTTACNYSLDGASNTSMSNGGTTFTASIGSPLLNKNYNITFSCVDNYNNRNSTTVYFRINDVTGPSISGLDELNLKKSSVDLKVNTDESVFGVLFYSNMSTSDEVEAVNLNNCRAWTNFTVDNDIEDAWTTEWLEDNSFCDDSGRCFIKMIGYNSMLEDPTFALSRLKSSTKYYYGACVCDKQRNCNWSNQNMDFTTNSSTTTTTDTSSSSSGGTADNETALVATAKIIGFWSDIPANTETEWKISSSAIPVTKVLFKVNAALSGVSIELSALPGTTNPSGTKIAAPNNVYNYLKISTPISGSVSTATMDFKIPASWFKDNNYDSTRVKAYRYVGEEWVALYTKSISNSSSYYTYTFDTPGFSYFAITAPNAPPRIVANESKGETLDEDTSNESIVTTRTIDVKCGDGNCSSNETCITCEKDCGICVPKASTPLDYIYDFAGVYYNYIAIVIIGGAIAFSVYYRYTVTGEGFGFNVSDFIGNFRKNGPPSGPAGPQTRQPLRPGQTPTRNEPKEKQSNSRKKPDVFKLD